MRQGQKWNRNVKTVSNWNNFSYQDADKISVPVPSLNHIIWCCIDVLLLYCCIVVLYRILRDCYHLSFSLFTQLPSGRRYRRIRSRTSRLDNSFYPRARLLNGHWYCILFCIFRRFIIVLAYHRCNLCSSLLYVMPSCFALSCPKCPVWPCVVLYTCNKRLETFVVEHNSIIHQVNFSLELNSNKLETERSQLKTWSFLMQ